MRTGWGLRMARCVLSPACNCVMFLLLAGAVALTDLQHVSLSSAPADTFSQVPKIQLNQSLPDSFMARFGQLTKLTGMCLPAATAAE